MASKTDKNAQAPKDPRQPEYFAPPPNVRPPPPPYVAAPPDYGMYGQPPPNYYPYGLPSKGPPPPPPPAPQRGDYEGKYKDIWASFLFILQFIAALVFLVYMGIKAIENSSGSTASTVSTVSTASSSATPSEWAPQLLGAAGIGFVFSLFWLSLIRLAPVLMIYVSLWWGVAVSAALGVLLLLVSAENRFVGIIFLVLAVLNVIYALSVRHRIPFAGAMMKQSVAVIGYFSSTIWIAFFFLFLSFAYISVWIFGVSGALDQGLGVWVVILLLLNLYWTMEVFRNTTHVTTCGSVATYYFQRQNIPSNPTGRALGRALTTSFGSICFGSFLVAFIHTLRSVVASLADPHADNPVSAILASCAECILGCIESLLRYFNKWAYVQVAVYGKSFMSAARDTWDLFQNQGFHLVINDDLTLGVLYMGSLVGGILAALATGFWTYFTVDQDLTVYIALISFFIAYFMIYIVMSIIESAVATYYVCYAEDPATLQRNDPAFYEAIRSRHTLLMR